MVRFVCVLGMSVSVRVSVSVPSAELAICYKNTTNNVKCTFILAAHNAPNEQIRI